MSAGVDGRKMRGQPVACFFIKKAAAEPISSPAKMCPAKKGGQAAIFLQLG